MIRSHQIVIRGIESDSDTESENSSFVPDTYSTSTSSEDVLDSETSSSNLNRSPNNTSVRDKMDEIMDDMKTINRQRETELQNYREKCANQDLIISSVKKCLNMDKLERDFEIYKKEMALKIKTLGIAKQETELANKMLKRKHDTAVKQLNAEKSLRLSAENSRVDLQKKADRLTKELENEKTLRRKAEDRVFFLESNVRITVVGEVTPKTNTNGLQHYITQFSERKGRKTLI